MGATKIIARAGEGRRLIKTDARLALGRVWVRRTNELYPEHSVDAIVKFGGWEPYAGDEDADAIISGASKPDPSTRAAGPSGVPLEAPRLRGSANPRRR